MGCFKNVGVFICSVFLYIFNGLLMLAGVIITIKGIYYLICAKKYSQDIVAWALKVDDFYREVGMSYVLPGCIMLVYSIFGVRAAGQKVTSLVIYSALTIMFMCANTYGVSSVGNSSKFSLYSYLNKVFISLELGNLRGIAYPEFGMQVALLASSVYLLIVHFWDKHQEAKKKRALKKARLQQALLQAEETQLTDQLEALKLAYAIRNHYERKNDPHAV